MRINLGTYENQEAILNKQIDMINKQDNLGTKANQNTIINNQTTIIQNQKEIKDLLSNSGLSEVDYRTSVILSNINGNTVKWALSYEKIGDIFYELALVDEVNIQSIKGKSLTGITRDNTAMNSLINSNIVSGAILNNKYISDKILKDNVSLNVFLNNDKLRNALFNSNISLTSLINDEEIITNIVNDSKLISHILANNKATSALVNSNVGLNALLNSTKTKKFQGGGKREMTGRFLVLKGVGSSSCKARRDSDGYMMMVDYELGKFLQSNIKNGNPVVTTMMRVESSSSYNYIVYYDLDA